MPICEGGQVRPARPRRTLRMHISDGVRVAWEGDVEGLHSLALVNRALHGADRAGA